jgi:hypothetical protein
VGEFRITSIEPVVSSAQALSAAFFELALLEHPVSVESRKEALDALEPAVGIIGQLFYVSEEELYRRDSDHVYLEMRIQRWYKDLVDIYPEGEVGLTKMAYKLTLAFNKLKIGAGISPGEIDFMQTCLSLVHDAMDDLVGRYREATTEFDSVVGELELLANLHSGEVVETDSSAAEESDTEKEGQPEPAPIFIYSQFSRTGEGREHYIFDPTSDEPNLVPKFTNQSQFIYDLFELASVHEGPSSICITENCIVFCADTVEAMGLFGTSLQVLIYNWVEAGRIIYLPEEALSGITPMDEDREESDPDLS